jgi:hypothetical protein
MSEKNLASRRKDITWTEKTYFGDQNANYTGGKYIDDKGYVRVLRPEHPKNIKGYVYEHRLVMEAYLGRMLEPWETVHHINEIKVDNRVENFFLCHHKEHSAIHREGRKPTVEQRDKMRDVAKKVKPHTMKRDFSKKRIKEKMYPKPGSNSKLC